MRLTVSINKEFLVTKIKKHLAIIAKRAKDKDGNSIFSEITTSTTEDSIYDDMMMFGAEELVSKLKDMCSAYAEEEGMDFIRFDIYSDRWNITPTKEDVETHADKPMMDLTKALESAITNYLYNYAVARYLSSVSPAVGRFADPYMEHCQTILQSVIDLAFVRRGIKVPEYPYTKNITTYGDRVSLQVGKRMTISYTIDAGKEDDVEAKFSDPSIYVWEHTPDGIVIVASQPGRHGMTLYSRHNSDVFNHLELDIEPLDIPEGTPEERAEKEKEICLGTTEEDTTDNEETTEDTEDDAS